MATIVGIELHADLRLPLITRQYMLAAQRACAPHDLRRLASAASAVRIGATGGGDQLLVLAWSAADLARERAAGCRMFSRFGVTAGMRVANTLPGALATPGSLLLGDVLEELGALDVPLGPVTTQAAARQAWELIDRVQPDVLVIDAASARALFDGALRHARSWWHGIVWLQVGARGPLPRVPAHFHGWQQTWLAVPESTSFVGASCAGGMFHIDEALLAEIVDASGEPVEAGKPGALALPLSVGDQPRRYATGVSARVVVPPCPCGAGGHAIELIGDPPTNVL